MQQNDSLCSSSCPCSNAIPLNEMVWNVRGAAASCTRPHSPEQSWNLYNTCLYLGTTCSRSNTRCKSTCTTQRNSSWLWLDVHTFKVTSCASVISSQLSGRPASCMFVRSSFTLPWYFCPCLRSQSTAGTPASRARSASSFPTNAAACKQYTLSLQYTFHGSKSTTGNFTFFVLELRGRSHRLVRSRRQLLSKTLLYC